MATDPDPLWSQVDDYFAGLLVGDDPGLTAATEASTAAGLPSIAVSPTQGALLHLLARLAGARRVLEIGTLGGYSTIWLARALPHDGRVVTLEADPRHAEVARDNLARAGLEHLVEIRVGAALDLLPGVADDATEPFDLVFVDADKPNIPEYFRWSVELTRVGGLVIVDNVVRGGAVVTEPDEPGPAALRRFAEMLASEPRVSATMLQTVGHKGYDGIALALVTG
jgi:predicted O-methyltransferase YrrM